MQGGYGGGFGYGYQQPAQLGCKLECVVEDGEGLQILTLPRQGYGYDPNMMYQQQQMWQQQQQAYMAQQQLGKHQSATCRADRTACFPRYMSSGKALVSLELAQASRARASARASTPRVFREKANKAPANHLGLVLVF